MALLGLIGLGAYQLCKSHGNVTATLFCTDAKCEKRGATVESPLCLRSDDERSTRLVPGSKLLQFDRSTLVFQFLLELLGVVLRKPFLDVLGGGLDEVLGFLEAQAGG